MLHAVLLTGNLQPLCNSCSALFLDDLHGQVTRQPEEA